MAAPFPEVQRGEETSAPDRRALRGSAENRDTPTFPIKSQGGGRRRASQLDSDGAKDAQGTAPALPYGDLRRTDSSLNQDQYSGGRAAEVSNWLSRGVGDYALEDTGNVHSGSHGNDDQADPEHDGLDMVQLHGTMDFSATPRLHSLDSTKGVNSDGNRASLRGRFNEDRASSIEAGNEGGTSQLHPNTDADAKVVTDYMDDDGRHFNVLQARDESKERRMFLLVLAKALMSFGAPSHRVEAHLEHCSSKLGIRSAFIQFPNIVIGVFFRNVTGTASIHFVRASGKVALTSLHKVHLVYRRVLHEKKDVGEARQELIEIIKSPPRYPRWKRCIFAFFQGAIICSLSFGGSLLDVFVGGVFTASVQWLNLYAVSRSAAYANVFDITSAIIVALCARLLSGIPGNVFCYNAISSAGIVLVLPGFNVLVSSLELISLSVLSGPVRMVYAIMYTMFLGFSLNAGSEIYFSAWPKARTQLEAAAVALTTKDSFYGSATLLNGTIELEPFDATFTVADTASASRFIVQGCFRDPHWPWWRQLLPWWTMLFLVPVYATLSCMSNLQSWRSKQFPVMICFSIATYAANRAARIAYPNQASFIAAAGATVIGFLGNLYGRIWRGSAFTTMVPGVLFLVPSALSGENGLNPSYSTTSNATTQFSVGFQLGIRMVQVALGVMAGVYVGESIAYVGGRRRKRNTPFAF